MVSVSLSQGLAIIRTQTRELMAHINPGPAPADQLRQQARELREKAYAANQRATILQRAAEALESGATGETQADALARRLGFH